MRLLTKAQLRRRLIVFAAMTLGFTVAVWATELTITAYDGITGWAAFAALLATLSFLSLLRWRAAAADESQEDWQPALMLRVLGGGLGFQVGVIGYFVSNDVVAASVGCAGFLFVLGYAMATSGSLSYAVAV